MSKRLCISLLHAPQRSQLCLQTACSLQPFYSVRRDNDPHHSCHRRRYGAQRPPQPQKRLFTSSCRQHAKGSLSRQASSNKATQPSLSVSQKNQMRIAQRDGSMLAQTGILQGTFVPPTGKNLPPIWRDWRGRLKIEWNRLFNWYYLAVSLYQARFMITPRCRLERGASVQVARDLYEEMYRSFARGDVSSLDGKVSPGLLTSLRGRIAQRPSEQQAHGLIWTLHKYLGRPEVVQFIFAVQPDAPKHEQTGIVQSVVRIRSRQSLLRQGSVRVREPRSGKTQLRGVPLNAAGNAIEGGDDAVRAEQERNAKDTTEYVVLQRYIRKSKPGPWHIWGTTEETTLEKLRRREQNNSSAHLSRS